MISLRMDAEQALDFVVKVYHHFDSACRDEFPQLLRVEGLQELADFLDERSPNFAEINKYVQNVQTESGSRDFMPLACFRPSEKTANRPPPMTDGKNIFVASMKVANPQMAKIAESQQQQSQQSGRSSSNHIVKERSCEAIGRNFSPLVRSFSLSWLGRDAVLQCCHEDPPLTRTQPKRLPFFPISTAPPQAPDKVPRGLYLPAPGRLRDRESGEWTPCDVIKPERVDKETGLVLWTVVLPAPPQAKEERLVRKQEEEDYPLLAYLKRRERGEMDVHFDPESGKLVVPSSAEEDDDATAAPPLPQPVVAVVPRVELLVDTDVPDTRWKLLEHCRVHRSDIPQVTRFSIFTRMFYDNTPMTEDVLGRISARIASSVDAPLVLPEFRQLLLDEVGFEYREALKRAKLDYFFMNDELRSIFAPLLGQSQKEKDRKEWNKNSRDFFDPAAVTQESFRKLDARRWLDEGKEHCAAVRAEEYLAAEYVEKIKQQQKITQAARRRRSSTTSSIHSHVSAENDEQHPDDEIQLDAIVIREQHRARFLSTRSALANNLRFHGATLRCLSQIQELWPTRFGRGQVQVFDVPVQSYKIQWLAEADSFVALNEKALAAAVTALRVEYVGDTDVIMMSTLKGVFSYTFLTQEAFFSSELHRVFCAAAIEASNRISQLMNSELARFKRFFAERPAIIFASSPKKEEEENDDDDNSNNNNEQEEKMNKRNTVLMQYLPASRILIKLRFISGSSSATGDPQIVLGDQLGAIRDKFCAIVRDSIAALSAVPTVRTVAMHSLGIPAQSIALHVEEDLADSLLAEINAALAEPAQQCADLVSSFQGLAPRIYERRVHADYFRPERLKETSLLRQDMELCRSRIQTILYDLPDTLVCGIVAVDTREAKQALVRCWEAELQRIVDMVVAQIGRTCRGAVNDAEAIARRLEQRPTTVEEMHDFADYSIAALKRITHMEKHDAKHVITWTYLLESHRLPVPEDVALLTLTLCRWPAELERQFIRSEKLMQLEKQQILDELDDAREGMSLNIDTLVETVDELYSQHELDWLSETVRRIEATRANVDDLARQAKVLRDRELLFDRSPTEFPRLERATKEFEVVERFWLTINDALQGMRGFQETQLLKVDAEELRAAVERWRARLQASLRRLRGYAKAVSTGRRVAAILCRFHETTVPLVTMLRRPGMRQPQWRELSRKLELPPNQELNPTDAAVTLQSLLDSKIVQHMPVLKALSEKVHQEYTVEQKLESLKNQVRDMSLNIIEASGAFAAAASPPSSPSASPTSTTAAAAATAGAAESTPTSDATAAAELLQHSSFAVGSGEGVLLATSLQEMLSRVEQVLVGVQEVRKSHHVGSSLGQAIEWEMRLQSVMDVLSLWMRVQESWATLYPVLSGQEQHRASVAAAAAEHQQQDEQQQQQRTFMDLHHELRRIVTEIDLQKQPLVYLMNSDKLPSQLRDIDSAFISMLREVFTMLDGKRQTCPRLFFATDEQLMECLSSSNTAVIQHLVHAVFSEICKLEERDRSITAVVSFDGCRFGISPGVPMVSSGGGDIEASGSGSSGTFSPSTSVASSSPTSKGGHSAEDIELFLRRFERALTRALIARTDATLKESQRSPLPSWLLRNPCGQITALVQRIRFTREVEEILTVTQHRGLKAYLKKQLREQEELQSIVRARTTLRQAEIFVAGSAFALFIQQRDAVEAMITQTVESVDEFRALPVFRVYALTDKDTSGSVDEHLPFLDFGDVVDSQQQQPQQQQQQKGAAGNGGQAMISGEKQQQQQQQTGFLTKCVVQLCGVAHPYQFQFLGHTAPMIWTDAESSLAVPIFASAVARASAPLLSAADVPTAHTNATVVQQVASIVGACFIAVQCNTKGAASLRALGPTLLGALTNATWLYLKDPHLLPGDVQQQLAEVLSQVYNSVFARNRETDEWAALEAEVLSKRLTIHPGHALFAASTPGVSSSSSSSNDISRQRLSPALSDFFRPTAVTASVDWDSFAGVTMASYWGIDSTLGILANRLSRLFRLGSQTAPISSSRRHHGGGGAGLSSCARDVYSKSRLSLIIRYASRSEERSVPETAVLIALRIFMVPLLDEDEEQLAFFMELVKLTLGFDCAAALAQKDDDEEEEEEEQSDDKKKLGSFTAFGGGGGDAADEDHPHGDDIFGDDVPLHHDQSVDKKKNTWPPVFDLSSEEELDERFLPLLHCDAFALVGPAFTGKTALLHGMFGEVAMHTAAHVNLRSVSASYLFGSVRLRSRTGEAVWNDGLLETVAKQSRDLTSSSSSSSSSSSKLVILEGVDHPDDSVSMALRSLWASSTQSSFKRPVWTGGPVLQLGGTNGCICSAPIPNSSDAASLAAASMRPGATSMSNISAAAFMTAAASQTSSAAADKQKQAASEKKEDTSFGGGTNTRIRFCCKMDSLVHASPWFLSEMVVVPAPLMNAESHSEKRNNNSSSSMISGATWQDVWKFCVSRLDEQHLPRRGGRSAMERIGSLLIEVLQPFIEQAYSPLSSSNNSSSCHVPTTRSRVFFAGYHLLPELLAHCMSQVKQDRLDAEAAAKLAEKDAEDARFEQEMFNASMADVGGGSPASGDGNDEGFAASMLRRATTDEESPLNNNIKRKSMDTTVAFASSTRQGREAAQRQQAASNMEQALGEAAAVAMVSSTVFALLWSLAPTLDRKLQREVETALRSHQLGQQIALSASGTIETGGSNSNALDEFPVDSMLPTQDELYSTCPTPQGWRSFLSVSEGSTLESLLPSPAPQQQSGGGGGGSPLQKAPQQQGHLLLRLDTRYIGNVLTRGGVTGNSPTVSPSSQSPSHHHHHHQQLLQPPVSPFDRVTQLQFFSRFVSVVICGSDNAPSSGKTWALRQLQNTRTQLGDLTSVPVYVPCCAGSWRDDALQLAVDAHVQQTVEPPSMKSVIAPPTGKYLLLLVDDMHLPSSSPPPPQHQQQQEDDDEHRLNAAMTWLSFTQHQRRSLSSMALGSSSGSSGLFPLKNVHVVATAAVGSTDVSARAAAKGLVSEAMSRCVLHYPLPSLARSGTAPASSPPTGRRRAGTLMSSSSNNSSSSSSSLGFDIKDLLVNLCDAASAADVSHLFGQLGAVASLIDVAQRHFTEQLLKQLSAPASSSSSTATTRELRVRAVRCVVDVARLARTLSKVEFEPVFAKACIATVSNHFSLVPLSLIPSSSSHPPDDQSSSSSVLHSLRQFQNAIRTKVGHAGYTLLSPFFSDGGGQQSSTPVSPASSSPERDQLQQTEATSPESAAQLYAETHHLPLPTDGFSVVVHSPADPLREPPSVRALTESQRFVAEFFRSAHRERAHPNVVFPVVDTSSSSSSSSVAALHNMEQLPLTENALTYIPIIESILRTEGAAVCLFGTPLFAFEKLLHMLSISCGMMPFFVESSAPSSWEETLLAAGRAASANQGSGAVVFMRLSDVVAGSVEYEGLSEIAASFARRSGVAGAAETNSGIANGATAASSSSSQSGSSKSPDRRGAQKSAASPSVAPSSSSSSSSAAAATASNAEAASSAAQKRILELHDFFSTGLLQSFLGSDVMSSERGGGGGAAASSRTSSGTGGNNDRASVFKQSVVWLQQRLRIVLYDDLSDSAHGRVSNKPSVLTRLQRDFPGWRHVVPVVVGCVDEDEYRRSVLVPATLELIPNREPSTAEALAATSGSVDVDAVFDAVSVAMRQIAQSSSASSSSSSAALVIHPAQRQQLHYTFTFLRGIVHGFYWRLHADLVNLTEITTTLVRQQDSTQADIAETEPQLDATLKRVSELEAAEQRLMEMVQRKKDEFKASENSALRIVTEAERMKKQVEYIRNQAASAYKDACDGIRRADHGQVSNLRATMAPPAKVRQLIEGFGMILHEDPAKHARGNMVPDMFSIVRRLMENAGGFIHRVLAVDGDTLWNIYGDTGLAGASARLKPLVELCETSKFQTYNPFSQVMADFVVALNMRVDAVRAQVQLERELLQRQQPTEQLVIVIESIREELSQLQQELSREREKLTAARRRRDELMAFLVKSRRLHTRLESLNGTMGCITDRLWGRRGPAKERLRCADGDAMLAAVELVLLAGVAHGPERARLVETAADTLCVPRSRPAVVASADASSSAVVHDRNSNRVASRAAGIATAMETIREPWFQCAASSFTTQTPAHHYPHSEHHHQQQQQQQQHDDVAVVVTNFFNTLAKPSTLLSPLEARGYNLPDSVSCFLALNAPAHPTCSAFSKFPLFVARDDGGRFESMLVETLSRTSNDVRTLSALDNYLLPQLCQAAAAGASVVLLDTTFPLPHFLSVFAEVPTLIRKTWPQLHTGEALKMVIGGGSSGSSSFTVSPRFRIWFVAPLPPPDPRAWLEAKEKFTVLEVESEPGFAREMAVQRVLGARPRGDGPDVSFFSALRDLDEQECRVVAHAQRILSTVRVLRAPDDGSSSSSSSLVRINETALQSDALGKLLEDLLSEYDAADGQCVQWRVAVSNKGRDRRLLGENLSRLALALTATARCARILLMKSERSTHHRNDDDDDDDISVLSTPTVLEDLFARAFTRNGRITLLMAESLFQSSLALETTLRIAATGLLEAVVDLAVSSVPLHLRPTMCVLLCMGAALDPIFAGNFSLADMSSAASPSSPAAASSFSNKHASAAAAATSSGFGAAAAVKFEDMIPAVFGAAVDGATVAALVKALFFATTTTTSTSDDEDASLIGVPVVPRGHQTAHGEFLSTPQWAHSMCDALLRADAVSLVRVCEEHHTALGPVHPFDASNRNRGSSGASSGVSLAAHCVEWLHRQDAAITNMMTSPFSAGRPTGGLSPRSQQQQQQRPDESHLVLNKDCLLPSIVSAANNLGLPVHLELGSSFRGRVADAISWLRVVAAKEDAELAVFPAFSAATVASALTRHLPHLFRSGGNATLHLPALPHEMKHRPSNSSTTREKQRNLSVSMMSVSSAGTDESAISTSAAAAAARKKKESSSSSPTLTPSSAKKEEETQQQQQQRPSSSSVKSVWIIFVDTESAEGIDLLLKSQQRDQQHQQGYVSSDARASTSLWTRLCCYTRMLGHQQQQHHRHHHQQPHSSFSFIVLDGGVENQQQQQHHQDNKIAVREQLFLPPPPPPAAAPSVVAKDDDDNGEKTKQKEKKDDDDDLKPTFAEVEHIEEGTNSSSSSSENGETKIKDDDNDDDDDGPDHAVLDAVRRKSQLARSNSLRFVGGSSNNLLSRAFADRRERESLLSVLPRPPLDPPAPAGISPSMLRQQQQRGLSISTSALGLGNPAALHRAGIVFAEYSTNGSSPSSSSSASALGRRCALSAVLEAPQAREHLQHALQSTSKAGTTTNLLALTQEFPELRLQQIVALVVCMFEGLRLRQRYLSPSSSSSGWACDVNNDRDLELVFALTRRVMLNGSWRRHVAFKRATTKALSLTRIAAGLMGKLGAASGAFSARPPSQPKPPGSAGAALATAPRRFGPSSSSPAMSRPGTSGGGADNQQQQQHPSKKRVVKDDHAISMSVDVLRQLRGLLSIVLLSRSNGPARRRSGGGEEGGACSIVGEACPVRAVLVASGWREDVGPEVNDGQLSLGEMQSGCDTSLGIAQSQLARFMRFFLSDARLTEPDSPDSQLVPLVHAANGNDLGGSFSLAVKAAAGKELGSDLCKLALAECDAFSASSAASSALGDRQQLSSVFALTQQNSASSAASSNLPSPRAGQTAAAAAAAAESTRHQQRHPPSRLLELSERRQQQQDRSSFLFPASVATQYLLSDDEPLLLKLASINLAALQHPAIFIELWFEAVCVKLSNLKRPRVALKVLDNSQQRQQQLFAQHYSGRHIQLQGTTLEYFSPSASSSSTTTRMDPSRFECYLVVEDQSEGAMLCGVQEIGFAARFFLFVPLRSNFAGNPKLGTMSMWATMLPFHQRSSKGGDEQQQQDEKKKPASSSTAAEQAILNRALQLNSQGSTDFFFMESDSSMMSSNGKMADPARLSVPIFATSNSATSSLDYVGSVGIAGVATQRMSMSTHKDEQEQQQQERAAAAAPAPSTCWETIVADHTSGWRVVARHD